MDNNNFFNCSGNSPTKTETRIRIIILAIDSTGRREDFDLSVGIKKLLNDKNLQKYLTFLEEDGYELDYEYETHEHYFHKPEAGLPLKE